MIRVNIGHCPLLPMIPGLFLRKMWTWEGGEEGQPSPQPSPVCPAGRLERGCLGLGAALDSAAAL